VTNLEPEAIFDARRQAELAQTLEQLDARPRTDRAEVFARAARTLAPPPGVARILGDHTDPA
jgi:hypothetical protein